VGWDRYVINRLIQRVVSFEETSIETRSRNMTSIQAFLACQGTFARNASDTSLQMQWWFARDVRECEWERERGEMLQVPALAPFGNTRWILTSALPLCAKFLSGGVRPAGLNRRKIFMETRIIRLTPLSSHPRVAICSGLTLRRRFSRC